ncbi:MAG TPA: hypothetical protein VD866_28485 [Urbifossiella sp.]|nr:hypothetical protein [Urbifossiella sp.]
MPDGRWAMRCWCEASTGGGRGGGRLYESRQAAVEAFVQEALSRFDPVPVASFMTKADHEAFPKMIARLSAVTLFGFEEPEPVPFGEWFPEMIAFEIRWLAIRRSWALLGVVRGMDVGELSKTGSIFDITTPWDNDRPRRRRDEDDGE